MSQMFSDQKKLKTGDTFTVDWVPGTGTVITVKGVPQGEPIKEPEFFNALLRIWLGPTPADWKLKEALLGRQAEAVGRAASAPVRPASRRSRRRRRRAPARRGCSRR